MFMAQGDLTAMGMHPANGSDSIGGIKAVMTIVDGKVVYEA